MLINLRHKKHLRLSLSRQKAKLLDFCSHAEEKLTDPKQNASSAEKQLSKVPNKIKRHYETKHQRVCDGGKIFMMKKLHPKQNKNAKKKKRLKEHLKVLSFPTCFEHKLPATLFAHRVKQ